MYLQLDGHKFEQALEVGDGSEAWCAAVHGVTIDRRQLSNWTELNWIDVLGLPRWHSGKESACQSKRCKRYGFSPWVGKISWSRKCNPLQHSCLENPMDLETWWTAVHGVAKSWPWQHACNWFTRVCKLLILYPHLNNKNSRCIWYRYLDSLQTYFCKKILVSSLQVE